MKRNKFLIIYGFLIIIGLILILFVIPEESFLKNKDKYEELKELSEKEKYDNIEIQKERLLKSEYTYEYNILHNGIRYVCNGTIKENKDDGICSSPSYISYNKEDKYNSDKLFNIKYVEPSIIFNKIKDLDYIEAITNEGKTYSYKTKISEYETDIVIYTSKKTITRIDITNAIMTYIIKYDNSKY